MTVVNEFATMFVNPRMVQGSRRPFNSLRADFSRRGRVVAANRGRRDSSLGYLQRLAGETQPSCHGTGMLLEYVGLNIVCFNSGLKFWPSSGETEQA